MKKFFLFTIIIGFNLCKCNFFNELHSNPYKSNNGNISKISKIFLGYKNNYPVFDAKEINTLFILKDSMETLSKYNRGYSAVFITDEIIGFKENKTLIVIAENSERRYFVGTDLTYVSAIDNDVYYTDLNNMHIKRLRNGEIIDTEIEGLIVGITKDYIFYSKESNQDVVYANVDIYRMKINQFKDIEIVVKEVAGENTFILPDGNTIFETKLIDGNFKPIIFDISQNSYKLININLEDYNSKPFYSFKDKMLIFYNCKDVQKINMMSVPL